MVPDVVEHQFKVAAQEEINRRRPGYPQSFCKKKRKKGSAQRKATSTSLVKTEVFKSSPSTEIWLQNIAIQSTLFPNV